MRLVFILFTVAVFLMAAGCHSDRAAHGPTVDKFNGRLTSRGNPVGFASNEEVSLKVFHEKGTSFGIPIQPDGTFKIGWMPIGKYSAMLNRTSPGAKGPPSKHHVPGGFTIAEGQTEYNIDLGPNFK